MMKAVQAAALFLMMMMGSASAGPLPPSLKDSRHADQRTVSPHQLNNKDSTRFESHPNVNNSPDDSLWDVPSNTTNGTSFPLVMSPVLRCPLPTCQIVNLGSTLQAGDQTAGGATTDPLGFGKK